MLLLSSPLARLWSGTFTWPVKVIAASYITENKNAAKRNVFARGFDVTHLHLLGGM
jgi:hypothetical protein